MYQSSASSLSSPLKLIILFLRVGVIDFGAVLDGESGSRDGEDDIMETCMMSSKALKGAGSFDTRSWDVMCLNVRLYFSDA